MNGAFESYKLDIAAGLTQVLQNGTNTYLYGAGRIAQVGASGAEYFMGDALGSVRQLVDANGNLTLGRKYKPYGEVLAEAGDGETSYGYTNEWSDSYTNLVYLRSRWYSPVTGRFLTKDTWKGDYRNPITQNRWNYAQANPILFTDPTGQWCVAGFSVGPGRDCTYDEQARWASYYAAESQIWYMIGQRSLQADGVIYGFLHEYLDAMSVFGVSSLLHIMADTLFGCSSIYKLDDPYVIMGRYAGRRFLYVQAAAEVGIGLASIGGGGGFTIGSGGTGAILGIPVATLGVEVAVHGTLVFGHVLVKEMIDPLPYYFSKSGTGADPTLGFGTNTGNTNGNAVILRGNLGAKGILGKLGQAAHHIVNSTNPYISAQRARELLQKFGIDINNAENGVFVDVSINSRLNNCGYMDAVLKALNGVGNKSEAIAILEKIGKQILSTGTYP